MKNLIEATKKISFIDAESIALNAAYSTFFGEKQPVGIAYTFINDRNAGNAWNDDEKSYAKLISQQTISQLRREYITQLIINGNVPDCAMARRFMATGSGQTAAGYNY